KGKVRKNSARWAADGRARANDAALRSALLLPLPPGEGEMGRIAPRGASARTHRPMHQSALYVRRKLCPSERDRDAHVGSSPMELRATRSKWSDVVERMNTSPDWLGIRRRSPAMTMDDQHPPSVPSPASRFSQSLRPEGRSRQSI